MTNRELVVWIAVWIVYHTHTLGTGTCSICRPAKSRSSGYGLLRLRGGRASPPRSLAAKRSTSETKTASPKKSSFVKKRKGALLRSSGNADQAKDDEEAIRQELMATFGDMKVNITSIQWGVCTDTCTETCLLTVSAQRAWRTCHDVAPHVCNLVQWAMRP
jgi:hypothetical protein